MKGTTNKISSQEGLFLKLLMTAGLPLMKNVLAPLLKIVLVKLGLTATASGTYSAIQKKMFGSGTTLVFLNKDLIDIMNNFLGDAGLLIKGVIETVKNEVKEQKVGFLGMLAASLVVTLLGNILARKRVARRGHGAIRAREARNRSRQDF